MALLCGCSSQACDRCNRFYGLLTFHRNCICSLWKKKHPGHSRELQSLITIAVAIGGSASQLLLQIARFLCDRILQLAEVIAVADRNLLESLQSLLRFTEVSVWPLLQARHCCSHSCNVQNPLQLCLATCGIHRNHSCKVTGKGEHGSSLASL